MANESSKKEQIGYHKGALSTLAKEREEFMKVLQVVEELMKMHIKALQELGVDLAKEAQTNSNGNSTAKPKTKSQPIEDLLK